MLNFPTTWAERLAQLLFFLIILGLIGTSAAYVAPVLAPVIFSLLLAYFLRPVVDVISNRGVRRSLAICVVGLVLLGGTLGIAAVFITQIVPEVTDALPQIQEQISAFVEDPASWLQEHPDSIFTRAWTTLGPPLGLEPLGEASGSIRESLTTLFSEVSSGAMSALNVLAGSVQQSVAALLNIILIPIFTFYFLMDFDRIVAWPLHLVPPRFHDQLVDWARRMDVVVGQWLRGQLLVALILGVLYAIGLSAFGLRLGWAIGLVAGMLNVVPYLGVFAGILMSLLMALMSDSIVFQLVGVLVVFSVVQLLEGNLITPKLVGNAVGMSPLLVMVVLLVGGSLFGFFGLVFAIPAVAAGTVVARDLIGVYRRSRIFSGTDAPGEAESYVIPNSDSDEEPEQDEPVQGADAATEFPAHSAANEEEKS
jgi:predicted PurR-regulated permease PerM